MKAKTVKKKRIADQSSAVAGVSHVEFWLLIDGQWRVAIGNGCTPRLRLRKLIEALWDDSRRKFHLYTNADLVADIRDLYGFKTCEEEVSKAAKAAGLVKVPREYARVRKIVGSNGKLTKGFVWFIPETREYPKLPDDLKTELGVRRRYNRQHVIARKEPKLVDAIQTFSKK